MMWEPVVAVGFDVIGPLDTTPLFTSTIYLWMYEEGTIDPNLKSWIPRGYPTN